MSLAIESASLVPSSHLNKPPLQHVKMKPFSEPFDVFYKRMGPRALLNTIMAACGAGFLLFGYDQGLLSGLLTSPPFEQQFPKMSTDAQLQGLVVAIYEIGCFLGAIITFIVGERFGRRKMIMYGMFILSAGAIIQAAAMGVPELIVGRIIAGIGNGFATATIPVYHSETSKAQDRGRAVCIELATTIAGVCIAYWTDFGFNYIKHSSVQWRFPVAFQLFFAMVTVCLIAFLPESPRWLIAHGREQEALEVLEHLDISQLKNKNSATMLNAQQEFEVIKSTIEEERVLANGRPVWKDICTNGKERHFQRALLGFGSQFMQQLSGINLITYYAPVILQKSVGLSRDTALLIAGFNGLAYLASSLVPIPLIERLGRRPLMLVGVAGQAICMAILAAMTVTVGDKSKGIVATTMLFLFNFFFSIGSLAIPWLLPAELNSTRTRMHGAAIATSSNWIWNFVVVMITPVCVKNIGYKTYVMFAIFNFSFIFITYFYYPETKGLQLEAVNELFEDTQRWHIGPVDTRKYMSSHRSTDSVTSPSNESQEGDMEKVITI